MKSGALMDNETNQGKDTAVQSVDIRSPLSQIWAQFSFMNVPWEVYWFLFLWSWPGTWQSDLKEGGLLSLSLFFF